MAAKSFTAQVSDFVLKTDKRMVALIRQSVQEVIDDAQLSDDKGGRMRVDTGFLRASGQPSLTGMPSGPGRGEKGKPYNWNSNTVEATLANVKVGNTIFFGWTANYAKYRETYDGFLDGALQKWPSIVSRVCAEIKARSGG